MSGFLEGAVTALAGASYLDSTRRATMAVFGPPAAAEVLAAENAVLRQGLAEWRAYAEALEAQNAELRGLVAALQDALRSRQAGA